MKFERKHNFRLIHNADVLFLELKRFYARRYHVSLMENRSSWLISSRIASRNFGISSIRLLISLNQFSFLHIFFCSLIFLSYQQHHHVYIATRKKVFFKQDFHCNIVVCVPPEKSGGWSETVDMERKKECSSQHKSSHRVYDGRQNEFCKFFIQSRTPKKK